MAVIEERIQVQATRERAWQAVVDFESRAKYSPRVKEAQVIGGGPLKEGSRLRVVVDRQVMRPTVTEVAPPSSLALAVKGPGFNGIHAYHVDANGGGASVSLTGQYGGLLGGMLSILMAGSFRRDLRDELEAIKKAAGPLGKRNHLRGYRKNGFLYPRLMKVNNLMP